MIPVVENRFAILAESTASLRTVKRTWIPICGAKKACELGLSRDDERLAPHAYESMRISIPRSQLIEPDLAWKATSCPIEAIG